MASGAPSVVSEAMLERAAIDPPGGRRRRARVPVEWREVSSEVRPGGTLRVRSFGAPVRIVGADRPDLFARVEVGATTKERLAEVLVAARWNGEELVLEPVWPGDRARGEFSWFEIEAPRALGSVIVETDVGSVELVGVSGGGEVWSGRGDVRIKDQGGSVLVRTANGEVVVDGSGGDVDVLAEYATVRVAGAAGSVVVRTTAGAVVVSLLDRAKGPVDVSSTDGEVDVTVGERFEGAMRLSSPGQEPNIFPETPYQPAITPDWEPFPRVHRLRFGEAEVVFSDEGSASSVRTTGASVTLRRRGGR